MIDALSRFWQQDHKIAKERAEFPELLTIAEGGAVAVNIRRALKIAFPGHKFSVRTVHHGTVYVHWTDGPTLAEVESITDRHESGHFDGMTDSYDYLRGDAAIFGDLFGDTRFIFCTRDYSEAAVQFAIERVSERNWNGWKSITLEDYRSGRAWQMNDGGTGYSWYSEIREVLEVVEGYYHPSTYMMQAKG